MSDKSDNGCVLYWPNTHTHRKILHPSVDEQRLKTEMHFTGKHKPCYLNADFLSLVNNNLE